MDRKTAKLIAKIHPKCLRADSLAKRAELADDIAENAENGTVMVVEQGRSLGLESYWHASEVPATVVAVEAHIRAAQEWLDGPARYWVGNHDDVVRLYEQDSYGY